LAVPYFLADLQGEPGFRIGGDDAKTLRREFTTIQPASSFHDLSDCKQRSLPLTALRQVAILDFRKPVFPTSGN
jgi:hypothetical protein